MGTLINYFFSKKENSIQEKSEKEIKANKNNFKEIMSLTSFEAKYKIELKENLYDIKSFPSGKIIATTVNGTIYILSEKFKIIKEFESKEKENKIFIKSDNIFSTYGPKIQIWSINFLDNNIEINLKEIINTSRIKQISFIDDDIIGIKEDELFYYIKNQNNSYKKSKNITFKSDELYSFIKNKDNKEIIIAISGEIRIYQIKTFELITLIKICYGDYKKKLFIIDENTFGCDFKEYSMSTALPDPNYLEFYDLKKKKLLVRADLDDYSVEYIRNGKFFISPSTKRNRSVSIYTLNDLKGRNTFKTTLNENILLKKDKIQFFKLDTCVIFNDEIFYLNDNYICIRHSVGETWIYEYI